MNCASPFPQILEKIFEPSVFVLPTVCFVSSAMSFSADHSWIVLFVCFVFFFSCQLKLHWGRQSQNSSNGETSRCFDEMCLRVRVCAVGSGPSAVLGRRHYWDQFTDIRISVFGRGVEIEGKFFEKEILVFAVSPRSRTTRCSSVYSCN